MKRILVIDDSPTVRNLIAALLQAAGHQTVQVENGLEGLKAFHAERFDLIITDIVMPVMEGLETIRAIRGLDLDIPILAISGIMTGAQHVDYLTVALTLGASRILHKPFTAFSFYAELDALLSESNSATGG